MGLFRFLFKWSLQLTGTAIMGYNYGLTLQKQADVYGFYRSCFNSYRAGKQIYAATSEYKSLLELKQEQKPQEYRKRLSQINSSTAKRIQQLGRTNKGVYMRLGQYLGHLKYALPTEFSAILNELNQRPNYQAEDYNYLKKHIQSQLGKKTKQLFESLNTSPIKSELFHQIYKGQLSENFLDINLKVMHPYASAQAKYDFWFLKKAVDHINSFKEKNFAQSQPLFLDLLYCNLKANAEQELNFKQQEKTSLQLKQRFTEIVSSLKSKINTRTLPVYTPHIYPQYTQQKIMIQQYFEGQHLSNSQAIFKQNYSKKSISNDLVGIWNGLLEKGQIIQSFSPFDIFIRKSRANEEGPYQICLLNLSQIHNIPQFIIQPYSLLWKEYIAGKKINAKKPQQRASSIKSFYQNLPQVCFSAFLNQKQKVKQLSQKVNIVLFSEQKSDKLLNTAKNLLPKQMNKKLQGNKILPIFKQKVTKNAELQNDYQNLLRAFQIQYQPWRFQILFKTYKQIFRQEKHFGLI